jgi:3-methylcrotonyl-CoA carboxylase beta subunit
MPRGVGALAMGALRRAGASAAAGAHAGASRALPRAPAAPARHYSPFPAAMNVLESGVDTRSEDYAVNCAEMGRHVGKLRSTLAGVAAGGGAKAVERHVSRGKLTARDRVTMLLDPGSPFLELSPLAGHELYEDAVPAGACLEAAGGARHRRPQVPPRPGLAGEGLHTPRSTRRGR